MISNKNFLIALAVIGGIYLYLRSKPKQRYDQNGIPLTQGGDYAFDP